MGVETGAQDEGSPALGHGGLALVKELGLLFTWEGFLPSHVKDLAKRACLQISLQMCDLDPFSESALREVTECCVYLICNLDPLCESALRAGKKTQTVMLSLLPLAYSLL